MHLPQKALHIAISIVLLSGPVATHAIDVSVAGTPGINGSPGLPGISTGNGTSGEDAQAVADDGGSDNRATAIGGQGGDGGMADPGTAIGQLGSEAGLPGRGGVASATALSAGFTGSVTAQAVATGGQSGSPGMPALSFPLSPEFLAALVPAAAGGSANAQAQASAAADAQSLLVTAQATGGRSGIEVFSPGSFTPGTGNGGNAQSNAEGRATNNSAVSVTAIAVGGGGADNLLGSGGAGGWAQASAHASNAGAQSVFSEATAIAGNGGNAVAGGAGGQAYAEASGTSSGGGAVTVVATQIAGASRGSSGLDDPLLQPLASTATSIDSIMRDQVSGSTSGQLTLIQRAQAGLGSEQGGHASSSLNAVHSGTSLTGTSQATGGNASHIGGSAAADISLIGSGAVTAEAIAQGGTSEYGGIGGSASVGSAYGKSTGGGDVSVSALVKGGDSISQGANVAIENAVSGDTSGALTLSQSAKGGDSTSYSGLGGTAVSILDASTDRAASLALNVLAQGGKNQGGATARSHGASTSGSLAMSITATGGTGGGSAVAEGFGTVLGDGHQLDLTGQASGKNAQTHLEGTASGNSGVTVYGSAAATDDSTATAWTSAVNHGNAAVVSQALASGGNSKTYAVDASTQAWGESDGGGDVAVIATQISGNGFYTAGNSIMDNQVAGRTTGALRLVQSAVGGSASNGEAGYAKSKLTLADTTSKKIVAQLSAYGGTGVHGGGTAMTELSIDSIGAVVAQTEAHGGQGRGQAFSNIVARSSGAGTSVTVSGKAFGGAATDSTNIFNLPASASSHSEGLGNAAVSVTDSAVAGPLGSGKSEAKATSLGGGTTTASATATSTAAQARATANTSSAAGPVRNIIASASGTGGTSFGSQQVNAAAQASFGDKPLEGAISGVTNAAFAVGAPSAELVNATLAGSPGIEQHLQGAEVLGLGTLRDQTLMRNDKTQSSVLFSLDTQAFTQESQHLLIGFNAADISSIWGDYFTTFTLTVKAGVFINDGDSFGGVSVFEMTGVRNGFEEKIVDLGEWSSLARPDGSLNLELALALGGDYSSEYPYTAERSVSIGFVIANAPAPVPVPATAWLLGSGLIGLAKIRRRARS